MIHPCRNVLHEAYVYMDFLGVVMTDVESYFDSKIGFDKYKLLTQFGDFQMKSINGK